MKTEKITVAQLESFLLKAADSTRQDGLVPFRASDGTWQGHLQTTWKNPDTGEVPGPIPVLLTIRQTFGRISCVMRTAEMTSRGYCADLWIGNDEQVRKLTYCYTSVPSVLIPDRSQPHEGAMLFEIIGEPAQKLRGNYWTTRKTTGEVTLTFRCREKLDDLPDDFGSHPMEGTVSKAAGGHGHGIDHSQATSSRRAQPRRAAAACRVTLINRG